MRRVDRPRRLAWQVFRGSDAVREGLLTAEQLRGDNWMSVGYNVFADSRLDRDHELRCRALALDLPPRAYFAGPSAACLHGVEHAAAFGDSVHLVVPAGARLNQRKQATVHRMLLGDDEVEVHRGQPVTRPLRTCWDLVLWLDLVPAVTIIDALLHAKQVTAAELGELARSRFGRHGGARAARAFALADGRAESPQESRLRLGLVRAGLPRPELQHPVAVGGRVLHPDLAWPEFKVAIEYDGEWHDAPDQFHLDRRRLNLLVNDGWIVLHVTSRRMRTDFAGIVREAKTALRSRGWRP
ncbi:endonuclease domain-containing protein [Catellatospora sichuanensis]|uniref:endonuclease domain-containing protein n=1 Tax=Catellatospora sichuanensis TaxID=1969805 RepID=UPI001FEC04A2|nr:hypothetical protein [Catellatospora sichuanensis]